MFSPAAPPCLRSFFLRLVEGTRCQPAPRFAAFCALILATVLPTRLAIGEDAAPSSPDSKQRWLKSVQEAAARAIERSGRSVVSIARFKQRVPVASSAPYDRASALDRTEANRPIDPKDPSFVPSEFAAGVVVDSGGLILTNYHVLAEESHYVVWSQRRAYDA